VRHPCPIDENHLLRYVISMLEPGHPRYDTSWRKSRLAARILLRAETGRITSRDIVLGRRLAADQSVTPRLIQQALHGFKGRKYQLELSRRPAA